jgi:hypothetical protein
MTESILNNINDIYENLNIEKAIFIIDEIHYKHIYNELIKKDFPISLYNDLQKFIDNKTRLLYLNITELQQFKNLQNKFNNITLILFISLPKIDDLIFINKHFIYNNINDINIIEI